MGKTVGEPMIKLSVMCSDEAYETRLPNCLRGEENLIVNESIVMRSFAQDADKGLSFLNKMVKAPPDIAILDVVLLRQAAAQNLSLVIEYAKKCSLTRIIIVGERFHEQSVIAMMKRGARGFIMKEHQDNDIIKCVNVVARGEIWLRGDLVGRVFDELVGECQKRQQVVKAPTSNQLAKVKAISRREKEILSLVCESLTNEEIAQKLYVSAKTVKTHIRNIFEKTGVRNRVEAALLYTRYKQETEN